jgi:cytochrome c-type biogenesis protein CcmH
MIWLSIVLLSALALLPCALLLRRGLRARDRHEAALALHRAQLDELERDRTEGLIADSEHASARLEIQRRLLAEAESPADAGRTGSRAPLLAMLALVPLASVGLYLIGGRPDLPAEPIQQRMQQADARASEDQRLLAELQRQLAALPPGSAQAHQGYVLLGQAEAASGDWQEAARAWHRALADGFDATLAMEAAEAQVRADGSVSAESAALFRRALDAAPKDAPWRLLAEQRIAQSEHH